MIRAVAACGLSLGACRSADGIAEVPPSIVVAPATLAAGPAGSRTRAAVLVQGIGDRPVIEWASLTPGAVAVDSVLDAGATVVLRVVRPAATLVVVTARGTSVLTDTLVVTLPAAR